MFWTSDLPSLRLRCATGHLGNRDIDARRRRPNASERLTALHGGEGVGFAVTSPV